MTKIYTKIIALILQNKTWSWACVALTLTLGGVSLHFAMQISSEYSLTQFQPTDDPLVQMEEQVAEQFLLQTTMPYILALEIKNKGQWIDSDNLATLESLTDALYENEDIVEVHSLATAPISVVTEEQLSVGSAQEVSDKAKLLENAFLTPNLLSPDGKKTALFILPELIDTTKHNDLYQKLQVLADGLPEHITARLGGPAAARTTMSEVLSQEVMFFSGLSLILAALVMFVVFQGWIHALTCLGVAALANIFAIGFLSALGIAFSVLTNTLPVITTITILALLLHTLIKLESVAQKGHKNPVQKTFTELLEPHSLTALTTLIGFATLIPSKVPLISEFGSSVCIAVTVSSILTLFVLPALLQLLPTPQTRGYNMSTLFFFQWINTYKKPLVVGLTSLGIISFFMGQDLNWSSRVFDDLPSDHPTYHNTKFIDKEHGGSLSLSVTLFHETAENYWKEAQLIEQLNEVTEEIKALPGVGSVISLADFIKSSTPDQRVPKENQKIAEIFFVYGMSSENPLDQFITPKGNHTRVSIRMTDLDSQVLFATQGKIKQSFSEAFPLAQVSLVGPAQNIHRVNNRMSSELIFGFFHALFWIILILSFVYRSLSLALFSAIPNLLPPSLLLGVLAYSNTPIKPGIAIIFAISLGIAFDNTVYLLSKLKEKKNLTTETVITLFGQESKACLVSSLVLAFGFSSFLASNFSMNLIFGSFMLVSIFSGLLGDLVLLPALLSWRPGLLNFSVSHGILYHLRGKPMLKPTVNKALTSLVLIAAITFFYQGTQAAGKLTAASILKNVQKNNSVPNEKIEMKMLIKERDGSTKERELVIKKKNGSEKKALIKLAKPADLKGVGLLNISKSADSESQWLFLPSEKRSRRLAGSGKGGNFLDSDLSYEDMSISTYRNFKNKLEKVEKKGKKEIAIIKSIAKSKEDTSYGKIRTWVDTKTSQILMANYYNHRGKLVKKITFGKYKKYGKVWRAHQVQVKNLRKKRETILKLKKVSLDKISPSEISMSALEEV